ncbi:hypothetical protein BC941DRAFT_415021 [Chlamydoabsidia padenii]|nr:hypothetical protein BC941DRAFT_415021 [Chlamydoabsidia padenii]
MELDEPTTGSPNINNNTMETEKDDTNSSDSSTHSLESNVETINQHPSTSATSEGQDAKNNKQEYPMDAVLTLMQLNAGWKK